MGARLGSGDPRGRPAPDGTPQALFSLASWQVGLNLIPWVHLAWHASFLWFVGPSCKCNAGLDHLCISSTFTFFLSCAFLLRSLVFSFAFQLWVPAYHDSPKLVELY